MFTFGTKSRRLLLVAVFLLGDLATVPLPAVASDRGSAPANAAGRQIASVTGIARGERSQTAKPAGKCAKLAGAEFLAHAQKALPVTVQDAADRSCQAARQCMHVAAANLSHFGQWLVQIDRQLNALPVATPVGSPYVTGSSKHLRMMPDGRLKTVIQQ